MRTRLFTLALPILGGLGGLGILAQHRELSGLNEEKAQILARLSEPLGTQSSSTTTGSQPGQSEAADAGSATDLSELLRLRRQVAELTDRKRELASARAENESLRAQVANRSTNPAAGNPLPPGYIRKSTAQWVGTSTPENALQSFLWALQTRDMTNVLRALTPRSGAQLLQRFRNSPDNWFQEAGGIPGLRVLRQRFLPDGSVELDVEVVPGTPPDHLRLLQVEGEWKLDLS